MALLLAVQPQYRLSISVTGRVRMSTCRWSSSTEIVTVGGAAAAPTVEEIFGLTVPAAANAAKIVTTARVVSSFIMEYLLFADVEILFAVLQA